MSDHIRIALIGDYDPTVTAHRAIPAALEIAGQVVNRQVDYTWIATDQLDGNGVEQLEEFDGLWCVPASPYVSMEGALKAIRFAREQGRPFLGTCGGYQHAILEYGRNVLGYTDADHAETNPDAKMPLIAPLACALVEENGEIIFSPGSRAATIYGVAQTVEQYRCRYGFNPHYVPLFAGSDMTISGVDLEGEPRVIELANHPFFIGAAFQPERSALTGARHPLITAYVKAASGQS